MNAVPLRLVLAWSGVGGAVALLAGNLVRPAQLHTLERAYGIAVFRNWLVLRVSGPFATRAGLLTALGRAVNAAAKTVAAYDPDSQRYDAITIEMAGEASAAG